MVGPRKTGKTIFLKRVPAPWFGIDSIVLKPVGRESECQRTSRTAHFSLRTTNYYCRTKIYFEKPRARARIFRQSILEADGNLPLPARRGNYSASSSSWLALLGISSCYRAYYNKESVTKVARAFQATIEQPWHFSRDSWPTVRAEV